MALGCKVLSLLLSFILSPKGGKTTEVTYDGPCTCVKELFSTATKKRNKKGTYCKGERRLVTFIIGHRRVIHGDLRHKLFPTTLEGFCLNRPSLEPLFPYTQVTTIVSYLLESHF